MAMDERGREAGNTGSGSKDAVAVVAVLLLSSFEPSELPDDLLDCGAIAYVHKADLDPAVIRRALDASNPQR